MRLDPNQGLLEGRILLFFQWLDMASRAGQTRNSGTISLLHTPDRFQPGSSIMLTNYLQKEYLI